MTIVIVNMNDNCKWKVFERELFDEETTAPGEMKCQVLDLEQGWHAFHGSFANLFHIQIRVKEARPKDVFYRDQKLKITQ